MTQKPTEQSLAGACFIWIMMIASVIPWRQGDYFSGGLDPVVIMKALLSVIALGFSVLALKRSSGGYPLRGWPVMILILFVAVSVVGAFAGGNLSASVVLAVRLSLLSATVIVMAMAYRRSVLLQSVMIAMAVVGLGAALTGMPDFLSGGGRLGSSIPPLSPNAISMLTGLPAIGCFHELVKGRGNKWMFVALLALSAVLVATGSRTALLAFGISLLAIVLHLRQVKPPVAAALIASVPIILSFIMFSPILQKVTERESQGSDATLNSRTIAWSAVLEWPMESWEKWIGQGLSVKTVPVVGQYWDSQVLDSSWISSLAQSGIIGTVLLAALCIFALVCSLRSKKLRSLTTPILLFIFIRSFLENGLTESSPAFMMFLLIILLVAKTRPTRFPKKSKVERVDDGVSGAQFLSTQ